MTFDDPRPLPGLQSQLITEHWLLITLFPGDHSEEETPVPIPNTAVKLLSGDGTVG